MRVFSAKLALICARQFTLQSLVAKTPLPPWSVYSTPGEFSAILREPFSPKSRFFLLRRNFRPYYVGTSRVPPRVLAVWAKILRGQQILQNEAIKSVDAVEVTARRNKLLKYSLLSIIIYVTCTPTNRLPTITKLSYKNNVKNYVSCDESARISYSHACVYLHIILVLRVFIT